MFISPIDARIRAVMNEAEYDAIYSRAEVGIYHDLSSGHEFLDCWCPGVSCDTCYVRSECYSKDPSFLDTYFPTLKQDHPELFI